MEKKKVCRVTFEFDLDHNIASERFAPGVIGAFEETFNKIYKKEGKVRLISTTAEYGKGVEYYR